MSYSDPRGYVEGLCDGLWRSLGPASTIAEFANNNLSFHIQMDLYKVLYDRQYRSYIGWFEPGKARCLGTYLIHNALDKVTFIQERLHTTQSKQKTYTDRKVSDVALMEGGNVLLRVSSIKDVMRFGKKIKLRPMYIGPF